VESLQSSRRLGSVLELDFFDASSLTVRARPGHLSGRGVLLSTANRFCTVLLYGRAGRSTAKHDAFRPGQVRRQAQELAPSNGLVSVDESPKVTVLRTNDRVGSSRRRLLERTLRVKNLPDCINVTIPMDAAIYEENSNYNATCVTWGEADWTMAGCTTVAAYPDSIHCCCTHLSTFGSLLFQVRSFPPPGRPSTALFYRTPHTATIQLSQPGEFCG
jgi:hypothetical protein